MRHAWLSFFFVALATIGTSSACAKPEPPKLEVKGARVSALTLDGASIQLATEVTNPLPIPLAVRSVTGNVRLDGKYDLGTVTVNHPVSLPAKSVTPVAVTLDTKWGNVVNLLPLAREVRPAPFSVAGTMQVGGESQQFSLPFTVNGTITPELFANLVAQSIPGLPFGQPARQ